MLSASDNLEIHAFDEVLAFFCKFGSRCRGGATELSLAASVTTTDAAPCTDRTRVGGYAGDEQDYRAQRDIPGTMASMVMVSRAHRNRTDDAPTMHTGWNIKVTGKN